MKIIPDASDFYIKNQKMLQNIRSFVPTETIRQAQNCVDTVIRFLKLETKGTWGKTGKLQASIDKEVLQTGQKTIIGIGNTEKMPIYWRIQEYGGNIPPRVPKVAKAMHFFGYGEEWFLKHVNGFTIAAKNYFSNGFSFAVNRAKVAYLALMNRIMR